MRRTCRRRFDSGRDSKSETFVLESELRVLGRGVSGGERFLGSNFVSFVDALVGAQPEHSRLDSCGNLITDGSNRMLLLYFRNFFYQDSLSFMKEPTTVRPFVVASTLMGFAFAQFPLITTLLSHHTDLLCEFIEAPSQDNVGGNKDTVARPSPQPNSRLKRKRTRQAPRATKKAHEFGCDD